MKTIEWRDEFSIGIPEVDHEHRELIALINATLLASQDVAIRPQQIAVSLGEVHSSVAAHFALEERVMQSLEYDQYPEHKRDHERLLDEIRDIMEECEGDLPFDAGRFAERLSDWFAVHFRTHDARFHRHVVHVGAHRPRTPGVSG
jgi:hemerythrin-like metal-binding protein